MYVAQFYDAIYDQYGQLKNNIANAADIKGYRVKTIKSGPMLEAEIYPIWNTAPKGIKELEKERKPTRRAQQNLNDKNAKKTFKRYLHTNFTVADIWMTFTYKAKYLPRTIKEAQSDMVNLLRRLKRLLQKYGVNVDLLKYLYVIEGDDDGKGRRLHQHVVVNLTKIVPDELKARMWDISFFRTLWKKGYVSLRPLEFDEFGAEGLAQYSMKDPKGAKRWGGSRNLKRPKEYIADTKISKKKISVLAKEEWMHEEFFEKLYKGYVFTDSEVYHSEYVTGAYIYVRMRDVKMEC